MSDASEPSSTQNSNLDREKFEFEKRKWEFEKDARRHEISTKESELELKRAEHEDSKWRKNPLFYAVLVAAIAAGGNAVVSYISANSQRELEAQKAEYARILEMVKTGDPDKAAENLGFLIDVGLIADATLASNIKEYLSKRKPGSGPALPLAGGGFAKANLAGADLRGAYLAGADLLEVNLQGANLVKANLQGANLRAVNLLGANLALANLKRANLADAKLAGAVLAGANLAGANLAGAELLGAKLFGANLEGVLDLTQEQLDEAVGDALTVLPAGLTRPAHWPGAAPEKPDSAK